MVHDTMSSMNDLPDPANQTGNQSIPTSISGTSLQKEAEPVVDVNVSETAVMNEFGKDMALPKEVVQAGVTIHPTSINIPPSLTNAGLMSIGQPPVTTVSQTTAINLPLTDDQIAQGLAVGMENSWRWLAEWCVRRLKMLHMTIKNIGGKGRREKISY